MIKKWISYYKEFGELVNGKRSTWTMILSMLIVSLLFLAPYIILMFNVFSIFGTITNFPKILTIIFPIYFQFCVGLFFKYYYQMNEAFKKEESSLNQHKAFLLGFLFLPTFVFILIVCVILFLV